MNEKLEKIKEEYMQIKASDTLKARIDMTMKASKRNNTNTWKKITGLVACLIIAFSLSLNLSPVFAATVADIPGMSEMVKALTFGRYVVKDGGYQASIETPKIEGLLDKELQDKLNKDFKDNSNALILAFESDMKELKKQFPGEEVHLGIDSGYIVKTDNENILAIDVYMANTVGSSSTTHKFYSLDKKTKTLLTLPSLFKKDSDYIKKLSEYITAEMKRQNEKGENTYWVDDPTFGPFKGIKENQNFYINNNGMIVICFDKYEVAPGSSGSPEFVIPDEVVKDILK
ncbi:anti-sigma-V factor rsiV [Desulfosporosinus fructosivorans]|uniref:Anti-sigma-V factor rsiV n=1 Tax=Desulfosporosinus fructosivorans TaxID=2018669 RepID=A0A4Z0RC29_9FIRM|nr:anti-sigma-V factor rsiV [Desulfosporosinus fructosivorans]TGE39885.1 anti-sigma-V factor rsiV [Desulfosporosinus fructosivorans]